MQHIRCDQEYIKKLLLLRPFLRCKKDGDCLQGLTAQDRSDMQLSICFEKLQSVYTMKLMETLGKKIEDVKYEAEVENGFLLIDGESFEEYISGYGMYDIDSLSLPESPYWVSSDFISLPDYEDDLADYYLSDIAWLQYEKDTIRKYISEKNVLDKKTIATLDVAIADISALCPLSKDLSKEWALSTLPFWWNFLNSLSDICDMGMCFEFGLLVKPFINYINDHPEIKKSEDKKAVYAALDCIKCFKLPQFAYISGSEDWLGRSDFKIFYNLFSYLSCGETGEQIDTGNISRQYFVARHMFDSLVLYLDSKYNFLSPELKALNVIEKPSLLDVSKAA